MRKLTETECTELIDLVEKFNNEVHDILWDKELRYNRLSDLKSMSVSIYNTIQYIKSDVSKSEPDDLRQLSLFND